MLAGGDELEADGFGDEMERAVMEVVHLRRTRSAAAAGVLGSPLAAMVRGLPRYVDPRRIGTPSDFQAWLLTVDLAGKATREELGFDALELLAAFDSGARQRDVAAARGWGLRELRANYERAVAALVLEFAARGITREIRVTPDFE